MKKIYKISHSVTQFLQRYLPTRWNLTRKEKTLLWLLLVIIVTTILKFVFVFDYTDYKAYLTSDMGGYWTRAVERFEGNIFNMNQWVIWPPFFHILLTDLFKINDLLGIYYYNLEIVLGINIILSSLSVIYLFLITYKFVDNSLIAFTTSAFYAVSYYTFYFNAFVLSENFAVPLVIASLYYLLTNRKFSILISGILLAISTGIRPGFGVLGLSFAGYAFISDVGSFKDGWKKVVFFNGAWKAALFSLGFFFIIFLIVAENNYISQGKLKGLAASSGINKYFSFTKTYEIQSRFDGYYYVIIPPGTVSNPENGKLITNEPIYNTSYFNTLTKNYIKEHPEVLIHKVKDLQTLFFGILFPSVSSVLWFDILLQPSRWLVFVLFLLVVFSLFINTGKRTEWKKYSLLLSVIFLSLLTCYLFNTEHRYLYSFMFAVYPIAIESIFRIITDFKANRKKLIIFILVIIIPIIAVRGLMITKKSQMTAKIDVTILEADNITKADSMQVDLLNFPFKKELKHITLGNIGYKEPCSVNIEGKFETTGDGFIEFYIYCEEGFEFYIDNNLILSRYQRDDEKEIKNIILLSKGEHRYQLKYFHYNFDIGIKAMYIPLFANDTEKYYFGEDTENIKFYRINELQK